MQRVTRMKRELAMLEREPPPGISCWAKEDDVTHLEAQIVGGDSTPYAGGVFKLDIQIPTRYPFEPPKVQYITPIYHPNIDTSGRICLDLLKMPPAGSWKPSLNISTMLTSLQLLMAEPNPEDPLMADISTEFKHNRALFSQKAKEWTHKHAVSAMVQASTDDSTDSDSDSSSDESESDMSSNLKSTNENQLHSAENAAVANQRLSTKGVLSRGKEHTNEGRGEKRCLQEVNGEPALAKRSNLSSL